MKDYEDVCKYASVETIPAAAEEEAPAPAPEEDQPEGEAPTNAAPAEPVDVMANIKTAVTSLTLEQAEELAGWLAETIAAARAAQEQVAEAA